MVQVLNGIPGVVYFIDNILALPEHSMKPTYSKS